VSAVIPADTLAPVTAALERLVTAAEAGERRHAEKERRRRDEARAERGYQSDLKPWTFSRLLPGCPELALAYQRIVPPEFWSLDRGRATVACPCGHEPELVEDVPIHCECSRSYVFTGRHVRVAGTPSATS
jgi:hypothetical protein